MKKTVEQHSQDLAWVKSTLCGFQWTITEKVNGLVQRMDALEDEQTDQEATTPGMHHGLWVDRLDNLAVSITDLETRFELLRSDTAAQLATFSVGLEHQRKELGGKEFLPTDCDLQECIAKASSHVARLEKFHEKWTEMQAVQGSGTKQFREVVEESVRQCTQNLLPYQELGALPQSSEASAPKTKGLWRYVVSSGNHFVHKPGIVNLRIQQCEGRIQEVVGRAPLPGGMQQIASPDAHLPPPENFHGLQQAMPSPWVKVHGLPVQQL